jgi:adenosylcobinamide kinase/adenosylcobinamide-phosphate guanylyltransferase
MTGHITFVLGGARSGKSRHAEALVRAAGPAPWIYVATAQAFDDEMRARIADHRRDRGEGWETLDVPHALPDIIRAYGAGDRPILVDCLTLWLTNRLLADADLGADRFALVAALREARAPVVLVSNEVGLGIVPDNALSRTFRDAAGRLHQVVAGVAGRVHLVVAGLPLTVKDDGRA